MFCFRISNEVYKEKIIKGFSASLFVCMYNTSTSTLQLWARWRRKKRGKRKFLEKPPVVSIGSCLMAVTIYEEGSPWCAFASLQVVICNYRDNSDLLSFPPSTLSSIRFYRLAPRHAALKKRKKERKKNEAFRMDKIFWKVASFFHVGFKTVFYHFFLCSSQFWEDMDSYSIHGNKESQLLIWALTNDIGWMVLERVDSGASCGERPAASYS